MDLGLEVAAGITFAVIVAGYIALLWLDK